MSSRKPRKRAPRGTPTRTASGSKGSRGWPMDSLSGWRPLAIGAGAALLVTLALVAALGRGGGGAGSGASSPGASEASTGAIAPATKGGLPRLSVTDVEGARVTVPGAKPGVLIFTASYCTPCIQLTPPLAEIVRTMDGRVDVLTLSVDPSDTSEAMQSAYAPVIGDTPGWRIATDPSGEAAPAFQITSLGTEIVYDEDGRQVFRGVLSDPAEIGDALRKALGA